MFRVQYAKTPGTSIKKIKAFILTIVKDDNIAEDVPGMLTVHGSTEHETRMKADLRASEYNGNGLAILGMKPWEMIESDITIHFPDAKAHAEEAEYLYHNTVGLSSPACWIVRASRSYHACKALECLAEVQETKPDA